MAGALIGALRVTLGLDATHFEEGTKGATRAARKLERDLQATGQALSNAGQMLTLGVTAPLTAFGVTAVQAAMESRDALSQVENTIRSMGNAAGLTAEQLSQIANNQMHDSLYDDDEILRSVTNTLLTFGRVTEDTFERAQQATLDLSAKFGNDLQGSAMMVGKALNDPVRGLAALRRVGISFTDQQKEQVEAMMDVGNVAGAQQVILAELERQVAGSARTAAEANPFTALKHSWDDFQESVGEQLLQILPNITDALKTVVDAFGSLSPEMQKWVVLGGIAAAALGPLLMALGSLVSMSATLVPAMISFGSSIASVVATTGAGAGVFAHLGAALGIVLRFLGPIGIAAAAAYAVWKNWDTIAPILDGLWESLQKSLGPPLMNLLSALSDTFNSLWAGPLGAALRTVMSMLEELSRRLIASFGPEIVSLVTHFGELMGGVINVVAGAIQTIVGLMTGDWQLAWNGAKDIVSGAVQGLLAILDWLVPGSRAAIGRMVDGIVALFNGPFMRIFNQATEKVRELTEAFAWMYDKVVGHSYVPDMVDEIATQMARLDTVMVARGTRAARATTEAMRQMAQDVRSLLSDLFPEAEDLRNYQDRMALIDRAERAGPANGGLTADQAHEARQALAWQRSLREQQEREAEKQSLLDLFREDAPLIDQVQINDQLDEFVDSLVEAERETEDKTANMIVSFAEMGRSVVGSMRSMVNAFKSGDILGGMMGVLDMVGQIASLIGGIKGNTNATRWDAASRPPGFSTGGSFKVGGSGGVDSQLIRFRATPGEMININRPGAMNDNQQAIVVHVVKGEMFDAHVERVAAPLAQRAGIQGAVAGSAMAQRDISRNSRNTLNG